VNGRHDDIDDEDADGAPRDADAESERDARPSRSSRKRAALAEPLHLPEPLLDALREARRLRSHGGLARQRQYIGKLMREVDVAAVEATLARRTDVPAVEAERQRRAEQWRTRLLREGSAALEDLVALRPSVDRSQLATLIAAATDSRAPEAARIAAARALFRALRTALR
jgi:ribosome-associated protein